MNYFWKGIDGPEESEAEESAESPEEKAEEFAGQFTLRRVERLPLYGLIMVAIRYNNSPNRDYEYYISEDDYEYDKVKIGQEIIRQNRERSKGKGTKQTTGIKDPHRFGTQNS